MAALQALQQASRLEMLDGIYEVYMIALANEGREDMDLICSLPALRHLRIAVSGGPPSWVEARLRQGLPHLQSLAVGSMVEYRGQEEFLEAAREEGILEF
jgi:hypothetical protein